MNDIGMDSDKTNEVINRIRLENREEISESRKESRDALVRSQRLKLSEIETLGGKISLTEFQDLVLKIKQKKPPLQTLRTLKNNCCSASRAEVFFKTAGAFDCLIRLLISNDPLLQFEAAACFTNLACGSHKASRRIAKVAGPYFVSFINSGNCYLQDQCAWAAGNIASECAECFSILKTQGVIPSLVSCLTSPYSDVLRSAVFALFVCTQYEEVNIRELDYRLILERIMKISESENTPRETVIDAISTISNIYYLIAVSDLSVCQRDIDYILCRIDKEVTKPHIDAFITLPLIRCLGHMTKSDAVCEYLGSNRSFALCMTTLLKGNLDSIKPEVLWVLSNISVSTDVCILDSEMTRDILLVALNSPDHVLQILYHLRVLAARNENVRQVLFSEDSVSRLQPHLKLLEEKLNCSTEVLLKIT